jgi:hypothetical protein
MKTLSTSKPTDNKTSEGKTLNLRTRIEYIYFLLPL